MGSLSSDIAGKRITQAVVCKYASWWQWNDTYSSKTGRRCYKKDDNKSSVHEGVFCQGQAIMIIQETGHGM